MVTSASSLIQGVVHYFGDDYKGCVQLAVSRLSRVRYCIYLLHMGVGSEIINIFVWLIESIK